MIRNLCIFIVNEIESLRDIARGEDRGCLFPRDCPFYQDAVSPEYKHYGRLASWWVANKERKATMKLWNDRK